MSNGPKTRLKLNYSKGKMFGIGKHRFGPTVTLISGRGSLIRSHLKSGNIGKAAKTFWQDVNIGSKAQTPKWIKKGAKSLTAKLKNVWSNPN